MQPAITNKYNIHHVESTRHRLYRDLQSNRSHRLRACDPLQRRIRTRQAFRPSQILPSQKDQKHIQKWGGNQKPRNADLPLLQILDKAPQPPARSHDRPPWLQARLPPAHRQRARQFRRWLQARWNAHLPSPHLGAGGQSQLAWRTWQWWCRYREVELRKMESYQSYELQVYYGQSGAFQIAGLEALGSQAQQPLLPYPTEWWRVSILGRTHAAITQPHIHRHGVQGAFRCVLRPIPLQQVLNLSLSMVPRFPKHVLSTVQLLQNLPANRKIVLLVAENQRRLVWIAGKTNSKSIIPDAGPNRTPKLLLSQLANRTPPHWPPRLEGRNLIGSKVSQCILW